MMTSVDLLLTLGGQIADILSKLLNQKLSNAQQAEIEGVLEQYKQINTAHQQIMSLLYQYNRGIEGITSGKKEALFPLCTYQGYQHIETLDINLKKNQINVQRLDSFEILSVSLKNETSEGINFNTVDISKSSRAETYTRERWNTYFIAGQLRSDDVINFYDLLWTNEGWKVNGNQVFSGGYK